MAAQQLDEMWDSQVSILNVSYSKTLDLLSSGKTKEASDEFHVNFVQAVKKIYSEAPSTYPTRFSKIDDWCSWVKALYVNASKADKALAAGNAQDAQTLLASLRDEFYQLHKETDTQQVNDVIYALHVEAAKDQPAAGEIKTLSAKLADAKPSTQSKAAADEFAKAKGQFTTSVDPLVADGKIDTGETKPLRKATDALYSAYGTQFE